MKLIPITLALVTTLGLAACETETEVMEKHSDDTMMEDAMTESEEMMKEAG